MSNDDLTAALRAALVGCSAMQSGPNGSGGMRVVIHFNEAPQEQPLFHLLSEHLETLEENAEDF